MQSAMKKPVSVPAQIWKRIRRTMRFTLESWNWSLGPVASSIVSRGDNRPVVMSCSTKDSRTDTIMAASIVSPIVSKVPGSYSRKTMKKIGTLKTSFVMLATMYGCG